jgi:hypothetical protein
MTTIFEALFNTYGENIMREHDLYEDADILEDLEELPMDRSTKVKVCDLFFERYCRWSSAAFAIGLHLGLSLLGNSRKEPRDS